MTCFPGTNIEFSKVPPCSFCKNVCPILPFRWHSPLPRAVCPLEVLVLLEYCTTVFVPVVLSLGKPMFEDSGFLRGCLKRILRQPLETLNVSSYSAPFCLPSVTLGALEIWNPGRQTTLQVSLIRRISCCCRDQRF